MPIEATICLIRNDGKLLLQRKAKGEYAGRWDAPGGKMKAGETPLQCAVREAEEETGIRVSEPAHIGTLTAYFGEREEPDWAVHVFCATRFSGRLRDSAEGPLRWFPEGDLPVDDMWPSDPFWLPDLLAGRLEGRRFDATFRFDDRGDKVLEHSVAVTERA